MSQHHGFSLESVGLDSAMAKKVHRLMKSQPKEGRKLAEPRGDLNLTSNRMEDCTFFRFEKEKDSEDDPAFKGSKEKMIEICSSVQGRRREQICIP